MASPGSPSPSTSKDTNSGYYYLVLAIAVMALLLTFNVVAVGCCARCSLIRAVKNFLRSLGIPLDPAEDEQISQLIPASKYKKEQWTGTNTECPVCLTTFMDGEEVRQLPECKHSFHAPCIDMWLRSHSSCPLCRAHVLLLQGLPHPRGAEVVAATEERWSPVDSSSATGMTGVVISML